MSLDRKRRSLSSFAKAGSHDTCTCGNVFMLDSIFCRKCGEKRPVEEPTRRQRRGESPREIDKALRKKDSELRTAQSELARARAEVQRLAQVSKAKEQDISKRDASVSGFRETQRMWEQETLSLRGKLAACEAEAHRERSIRDAEISRMRLVAEEARQQAKALKATCKERIAQAQEEVETTRAELLRQVREKDAQLQRQWQELNTRIEGERQRHAHTQAYETERGRSRADALEARVRDLEGELSGLRAAKTAVEVKLRSLNEEWLAAERKSARLMASSSAATRERDRLAADLTAQVTDRSQAYERQLTSQRSHAEALREVQQRDAHESLQHAQDQLRAEAADELRNARREEAAVGAELEAERAATVTLRTELALQQQQQLQLQQHQQAADRAMQEAHWQAQLQAQAPPPADAYRAECPESPLTPASPVNIQTPRSGDAQVTHGSPAPRASRLPQWPSDGELRRSGESHVQPAAQPDQSPAWSFEDGKLPPPPTDTMDPLTDSALKSAALQVDRQDSLNNSHGAALRSPSPRGASRGASRSPQRAGRSPIWSPAALRSPGSSRSPSLARGSPSPVSSRWQQELSAQQSALQRAEEVGEVCRRKAEALEEQLEHTARERSRERNRATEEAAALRRAQELRQRHHESELRVAQEAQLAQERLREVQTEEATWRRHAEAELGRTARERDRMIEATNELRADLRAARGDTNALRADLQTVSGEASAAAGAGRKGAKASDSFTALPAEVEHGNNARLSDSLLAVRERRRQEGGDSFTSESLLAMRSQRRQEKSSAGESALETGRSVTTFGRLTNSRDDSEDKRVSPNEACSACGNIYMPDSNYCRKCGKQRHSAPAWGVNGSAGIVDVSGWWASRGLKVGA